MIVIWVKSNNLPSIAHLSYRWNQQSDSNDHDQHCAAACEQLDETEPVYKPSCQRRRDGADTHKNEQENTHRTTRRGGWYLTLYPGEYCFMQIATKCNYG